MNKVRRKAITELQEKLQAIVEELEPLKEDEKIYYGYMYDNMPEIFKKGDKALASEEAIENLEEAIAYISDAIDCLGNVQ